MEFKFPVNYNSWVVGRSVESDRSVLHKLEFVDVHVCGRAPDLTGVSYCQNQVIRQITNARWLMRNEDLKFSLNLQTIREFMKQITTIFFTNIPLIDNRTLRKIEIYDPDPSFNRPRNILL
ncbi:hypothetical protein TNIN_482901 [Trichonephila inaurata madagascariensis]|uniref:Uncharacterized protein n=1 Tax=Trichonephila inaurata madagascariensis TaxID=2747483 RepID=A0A8X6XP06_9ARAC|nr:hypothetical protein TNIN_482901 [Trichonephila inaurata madagascariensis]